MTRRLKALGHISKDARPWLCAALLCLALTLATASTASADGTPQWAITSISNPTKVAPGSNGDQFIVTAINSGEGVAESGITPITITDTLPGAGVTLAPAGVSAAKGGFPSGVAMKCQTTPTVACTTTEAVIPGDVLKMVITVDVAGNAPAVLTNQVSIAGGGAAEASASTPTSVSSTPAGFGLAPGSFLTVRSSAQAGAHPTFTTAFSLATEGLDSAAGSPKQLTLDLPPGIVDQADSIPQCTMAEVAEANCPRSSAIGRAFATIQALPGKAETLDFPEAIYDVAPNPGETGAFAFDLPGHFAVRLDLSLAAGNGYHMHATIVGASEEQPLLSTALTFWGIPADLNGEGPSFGFGDPGVGPRQALLTNPTSCGAEPLNTTLGMASGADPSAVLSATSSIAPTSGCALPGFAPTFTDSPDPTAADSSSGFTAEVQLPQNEEPDALASSALRRTVVTLPKGLTLNTSAASGLGACSPAQVGLQSPPGAIAPRFTEAPASCPQNSRLGTLAVESPLFDHPLPGSIYLAQPFENPFGSLIVLYATVEDPETGVVVKVAGLVEPNQASQRLTTTFEQIPQLPVEEIHFELFDGPHADLRTPPTCGGFTTTTDLTPWTSPEGADAKPSSSFQITSGAGGSACSASEAALPNKPSFQAAVANPQAGSYSPFDLKLSREDGSQELKDLDVTLPEGLLGKLAGIPYCPDAQLAAAAASAHSGAAELANPSCPAASQIGTVKASVGAGLEPLQVSGRAYLAGPYRGAPFSMAIVVPAIGGPFDFGNVVVRSAFHIDPVTAQVEVTSDSIPTELMGIPLDIRSLEFDFDRPNFTLNPTNCEPKAVLGTATSVLNQPAALSYPFQVTGCSGLGFDPRLALHLKGGTKRDAHPSFSAELTVPTGPYANFSGGAVTLPHSEFVDQSHIKSVCTRVQFAEHACPPESIYGYARFETPLVSEPFVGPLYLRSSSNELPDLVADLHSGALEAVIDTSIGAAHGGLRGSVESVPDVPLTSFTLELPGGKKGLLVNSEDLCGSVHRAFARFSAQNGLVSATKPVVTNSCPRKRHRHKKGKHRGRHHR